MTDSAIDVFEGVHGVIAGRTMSVKARLAAMGKVAEHWDERHRGR
jgi:hypothetical protein